MFRQLLVDLAGYPADIAGLLCRGLRYSQWWLIRRLESGRCCPLCGYINTRGNIGDSQTCADCGGKFWVERI